MSRAFKMRRDADLAWRCSREGREHLRQQAIARLENDRIASGIWERWKAREQYSISEVAIDTPFYEHFSKDLTEQKEEE